MVDVTDLLRAQERAGDGTSLHKPPGAAGTAGTAAGLEHLPQVDWQKLPSNMKGALHLPNDFCMTWHIVSTETCLQERHVCLIMVLIDDLTFVCCHAFAMGRRH